MKDQNLQFVAPKWLIPVAAISGLLLVILFALGFIGGGDKISAGTAAVSWENLPDTAKTYLLTPQVADQTVVWQGTVRSRLVVKVAPRLNARILEVLVHPGQRVKQGEILVKLDDRDLRAASEAAHAAQMAAKAQAVQAETEAKRITDLYQKQAATRQNYDALLAQAKAMHAMALQAASTAQQSLVMLAENVLRAAFDGIIGERLQEPGDMGLPNQPIVTLFKPDDLRLETAISSHCAKAVQLGMQVAVRIDAIGQQLIGKVDEITPETDPQTRSQNIKVSLPKTAGLQHGQFAWLELACSHQASEAKQSLLIPSSAVLHYGQLQAVKVVIDKQLQVRHIRTGKQYADQVEVLSGLHEGDIVLLNSGLQP
ncbi:MAG: efflux RND transporter periplasmic adaptor subunit [Methylococcaceae bacterium]|jgi:RND family efflux transporter MFP subunit